MLYAHELELRKASAFDDINVNAVDSVSRWHAEIATGTGGMLGPAVLPADSGYTSTNRSKIFEVVELEA